MDSSVETTSSSQQSLEILRRVEELVEELKISSLNLTINNAKLRMKDPAFQAMSKQFSKLLDNAAESYNEADYIVKLAKGEKKKERGIELSKLHIDDYLSKIQETAEEIIKNVVELKQSKSFGKKI